jgi:hypothetical protein
MFKFYTVMVLLALLSSSEFWTMKIKGWTKTQAAEMKILKSVQCRSKIDRIGDEDLGTELGIFSLNQNNGRKIGRASPKTNIPFKYKPN